MYVYAGNNPVRYIDPDGRIYCIGNESFSLNPKQENKIYSSLSKKLLGFALIGLGNFLDKGGGVAIAAAVTGVTGGTGAVTFPVIVAGSAVLGKVLEVAGTAIILDSCVEDLANSNVNFLSSGDSHNKGKKPTSPNQMQNQVNRGQAPKDVKRVDNPKQGQPHVHFKDGTALNQDGSVHDAHNGIPKLSNEVKEWLLKNGWSIGE